MYKKCISNEEKLNIPCERKYYNITAMSCGYSSNGYVYFDCPKCKECHLKLGLPYRKYIASNSIINDYGDNRLELLIFDKPFAVLDDYCNLDSTSNARNYHKVDTEEYGLLLIPRSGSIRDNNLYTSLSSCSKRAQENYYGKALSNKWKYFVTLTVSPDTCNRYNDYEVKDLWRMFRDKITKQYPDIMILCVPERHKDGALHFHCLMSLDKDLPLKPYISNRGQVYSRTGAPLYTSNIWKYGICTLAIIPPEDNQCAVINYLIAYTTKQSNLGYGQRRFYCTRNLLDKDKSNYMEEDMESISDKYDLVQYKRVDGKFTVYRNFNINVKKEDKD